MPVFVGYRRWSVLFGVICMSFAILCEAQDVDMVFGDYQTLLQLKASLAQNDQKQHARLIERAAACLKLAPESAMQKKAIPPSGDKHDYVSLGPYWWPDPNQPDGLPYIRRDGRVNPETRGHSSVYPATTRLFARVYTLAMAAFNTDDSRYARKAANLLETWFIDPNTRMNPHLE